jgi:PKD domain-containing protein
VSRSVRMLLASALGALGLGAMAGPASAGIWSEIPSGTTEEITAIEYRGGDQFWFTTGSGKIFKRVGGTFQQKYSGPGVVFRDIEFDASGVIGLAVGTNGRLARSTNGGDTWAAVPLPASGHPTDETNCGVNLPAGDLDSVRIDGLGRAWIVGSGSQIWRSPNTGLLLGTGFVAANDGVGAACAIAGRDFDAMVFIPGDPGGYFIAKSFGQVFFSSDPFTTSAAEKLGAAGNGFTTLRRAVGDPSNTNRMWAVTPGNGGTSYVKRTIDGWGSELEWAIGNPDKREFSNAYDIDYAGGTVLTAGAGGMVLHSIDGEHFYYDDADGVIATQDWRAVSVADGSNGAIGGTNGKLAVTTAANVTPDVTKPTGTISGPTSANAGQPVTFTLNAADTGGSGLNPASYAWTSAGLPNTGGNPATFTFSSPGFYTVKVTFADNAGNSETATHSITINKAPAGGGTPTVPVDFTGRGNKLDAKIVGNRVRVRARGTIKLPAGASCSGKVKLTVKRKRTTLAQRSAKLKRKSGKCRFGKTIFIKRSKVGRSTTRLRLKVSITGNTALKFAPLTKTLVIKK